MIVVLAQEDLALNLDQITFVEEMDEGSCKVHFGKDHYVYISMSLTELTYLLNPLESSDLIQ